ENKHTNRVVLWACAVRCLHSNIGFRHLNSSCTVTVCSSCTVTVASRPPQSLLKGKPRFYILSFSRRFYPKRLTVYTHFTFTLMAHCTSGAIRGSVSCSRTLRQGIELATF